MDFHLSISDNINGIFDLSPAFDAIRNGDANTVNLYVEFSEVLANIGIFEKTLFLADLLQVCGIYIKAKTDLELPVVLKEIYKKSRFSDQKNILASPDETRSSIALIQNCETAKNSNLGKGKLRSIVYWDSKTDLLHNHSIQIQIDGEIKNSSVVHIQKVIFPDFSGSQFGIQKLSQAQFGTVLLDVREKIEYFTYSDNPSKGFFTIHRNEALIGCGISIK